MPGGSEARLVARRRAATLSAAMFAALFLGMLLLVGAYGAYQRSSLWVDHSHQVLGAVDHILIALTEAETGQRGYLLTRDRIYLNPHTGARDRTGQVLDELQALTADNHVQQDNIRALRPLVDAKLDELALTLTQADGDGVQKALATVREGTGERLMTRIRDRIVSMRAEEENLLDSRSDWATALGWTTAIFGLVFAAAAVWMVRSSVRRLERDYEAEKAEGQALADALARNSLLLDEVNHRVKNSLQIVSNLLRSQALKHPDPVVREQLLDNSRRVEAIAEVHRRLYGTDTYDTVELTDLLRSIADGAVPLTNMAEGTADQSIDLSMEEPIPLPVREAVPLALIVNELLTNSVKHAFPDGRASTVRLSVQRHAGQIVIRIEDNGIGIPDDVAAKRGSGFGMGMVKMLTAQLKGNLDIERPGTGTRLTLRIPHAANAQA